MRSATSNSDSQPTTHLKGNNVVTAHAKTELVLYEPEHIIVNLSAPTEGWLLLSDAWYPGWEVTVDGRAAPVERANVLFRAVAVDEGEHQVEWKFRPASFRLGLSVTLGTLGLLLAVVMWTGLSKMSFMRRGHRAP